jgi:hypothetical protein
VAEVRRQLSKQEFAFNFAVVPNPAVKLHKETC